MPGSLTYKQTDPNYKKGPEKYRVLKDRGPGKYYHRGNGHYSKYSSERDTKIKARGWRQSKIGLPKSSKVLHAGDGYLPR